MPTSTRTRTRHEYANAHLLIRMHHLDAERRRCEAEASRHARDGIPDLTGDAGIAYRLRADAIMGLLTTLRAGGTVDEAITAGVRAAHGTLADYLRSLLP